MSSMSTPSEIHFRNQHFKTFFVVLTYSFIRRSHHPPHSISFRLFHYTYFLTISIFALGTIIRYLHNVMNRPEEYWDEQVG